MKYELLFFKENSTQQQMLAEYIDNCPKILFSITTRSLINDYSHFDHIHVNYYFRQNMKMQEVFSSENFFTFSKERNLYLKIFKENDIESAKHLIRMKKVYFMS